MIDFSKCTFGESCRDEACKREVYFFDYPVVDLTLARFTLEPYDNVVSMCIELSVYDDGGYEMEVSPTIEDDDGFSDVDWRALYEDIHYKREDVEYLKALAEDTEDYFTVVHQNPKLEDNETSTGGTASCGETLKEFLEGFSFTKLSSLNKALDACGIKPVSPK